MRPETGSLTLLDLSCGQKTQIGAPTPSSAASPATCEWNSQQQQTAGSGNNDEIRATHACTNFLDASFIAGLEEKEGRFTHWNRKGNGVPFSRPINRHKPAGTQWRNEWSYLSAPETRC
jgi:hypothetical protein